MVKKVVKSLNHGLITGIEFDQWDFAEFVDILKNIKSVNERLNNLGGRKLNVPDVVSEGIFCYLYDAVRTNSGNNGSQDAVMISTGDEVQIKSASIPNDLTSFGPGSTWTRLYFMDFAPNGSLDGQVDIYLITTDIKKEILNARLGETFEMQQQQGRRPRLSLKTIIKRDDIPIDKTIKLF